MAVTLVPATTEESLIAAKGNAPKFFKEVSDLTFRKRLWLGMIQKYGRVEYNASSFACVWNVEKSQPDVQQAPDGGDLDFQEHDAEEQLTLDVRGYRATDMLTEKKMEMNKGATQITNYYRAKSARLAKSVQQKLYGELYVDGYTAANADRFHGIESFTGDDAATVAADKIARPADTYGGKSTAPGAEGTWSSDLSTSPNAVVATDWPYGTGSAEYDYLSPLLVNTSSTAWPSASAAWVDNAEDVLRFARITQSSRGAMDANEGIPFMHMLATDLYEQFLSYYSAKLRMYVPHAEATNLGFGNTMNFEGDMVHYESDTPVGTGYGIAPSQMDMFCLFSQLIKANGPDWSKSKASYLYYARTYGNLRFQPKFFTKYKAYA